MCGDEIHRLKYDRSVRRWDEPTEIGDGGMAMGCASLVGNGGTVRGCAGQKERWWHGEGMRRQKMGMVARRGDAPAKNGDGHGNGMRQPI